MPRPGPDSPPARAVTIYDVARQAGVASSTVSRAFSRPGRVSSVTAERIRRIADEMGYRAMPPARTAAGSRTQLIALAISDIGNPFFTEIAAGAQDAAVRRGYTVLVADGQESGQRERAALDRLIPVVDGVIFASSRMPDSALRMVSKQKPVVVLNREITDVPSVVIDHADGARRVAAHLAGLGRCHLTYLAGPEASWADGMRWRSLRAAAASSGLRARRAGPYSPDVPGGASAAPAWREHPAPAVVAYNDQMAIGFIAAVSRCGVSVPADVSVVGFDNIPAAQLVTPALTTVAAPLRAEGAAAVSHLIAMIEGAAGRTGSPVVLPVALMIRESTAPAAPPAAAAPPPAAPAA